MKKSVRKKAGGPVPRLVFLIYCAVMLWLLFGQRLRGDLQNTDLIQQGLNINLVPLHTLKQYWGLLLSDNAYYVRHAIVNLVGNVIMFVPLGLLLPWIWPSLRGLLKMLLCTLTVMVLVEAAQYLTGLGSCDVDDLILNLLGALTGYGIWRIGCALKKA